MGGGPARWTGVEEVDESWRDVSFFWKAGGGIRICDAVGPRAFDRGARASSEMGPTAFLSFSIVSSSESEPASKSRITESIVLKSVLASTSVMSSVS